MQFWYTSNQILASINKLTQDNIKLILKEMSFYLGEEIIKEVILNIDDSKLVKLTCDEYSFIPLYLLKICLDEFIFSSNTTLCIDCTESNKVKNYIVNIYY